MLPLNIRLLLFEYVGLKIPQLWGEGWGGRDRSEFGVDICTWLYFLKINVLQTNILIASCDSYDQPFPKGKWIFRKIPYMISTSIFSRISGRVLWPLPSKSPNQNCINKKGLHWLTQQETEKSRFQGGLIWLARPCVPLGCAVSMYEHQPQAEPEGWGIPSLYLCIWMFRALEKGLLLENLSDTWEKHSQ